MGYTTTTTSTRNTVRAGVGIAALSLLGALLPMSAASAADPWSAENLQKVCDGEATMHTQGLSGTCTFEVQGEGPQHIEWLRYGEPVSNCNAGTTTPIRSVVGDVRSVSETWTVSGGVEFTIEKLLKVEAGAEYSETRTTTRERRDEVTANPGRKTAVTLGTGYVDQTGRIRVDVEVYDNSGNDGGGLLVGTEPHYIEGITRVVPNGYIEKGQDEVSCAEDFRVPA